MSSKWYRAISGCLFFFVASSVVFADDVVNKVMATNVTEFIVTVIRSEDGQPIKNARVIVTYSNFKEYERRTDGAGSARLTSLPYGKVDVVVTSSGRQSDGSTLVLDEPKEILTFHLKPRAISD